MASSQNGLRPKAASKPRIIRPMSEMEAYHSALHCLRQLAGTVVNCRYTLPASLVGGSRESFQNVVYRVLARTVIEHPMLQVGLLDEDSKRPSWIELDSIDLSRHVEWVSVGPSEDYHARHKEVIGIQLDTFFEDLEERPGWRISIVFPEGRTEWLDIALCWNHANFDGVAGKIFHQCLLRNFNDSKATEDVPNLAGTVLKLESVADRFPPPPEKVQKFPVTLKYTGEMVWKELIKPAISKKENPRQIKWAPMLTSSFRRQYREFSIGSEALRSLIAACRRHKTTIAGLMNALPAASLALQLDGTTEASKEPVMWLHGLTALDLRRFMPVKPPKYPWLVPDDTLDNELTVQRHGFDATLLESIRKTAKGAKSDEEVLSKIEDIVWSMATRTRAEIQQRIDQGIKNDQIGVMKYVGDWRDFFKDRVKQPRVGAWGVSNLGVIDGGVGGDEAWGIERASFELGIEITAAVFHISAITVKGKDMCVDVSWQEGIIPRALGDKVSSDMEAWMLLLGWREVNGAS